MVFFKEDLRIIVGYFGSQNSTDERMEIRTTEFMNYEMHLIQKHSRTWRIAPSQASARQRSGLSEIMPTV